MKLKELHLHNNKLGYEGVEKLSQELAKPLSKSSSKPGNKILEVLVGRRAVLHLIARTPCPSL